MHSSKIPSKVKNTELQKIARDMTKKKCKNMYINTTKHLRILAIQTAGLPTTKRTCPQSSSSAPPVLHPTHARFQRHRPAARSCVCCALSTACCEASRLFRRRRSARPRSSCPCRQDPRRLGSRGIPGLWGGGVEVVSGVMEMLHQSHRSNAYLTKKVDFSVKR